MKIETISGALIDPTQPNKNDIKLNDIAWSLSRISRFAGHTITTVPYTVGQHCAFVADMLYTETNNPQIAMYGLLHDASEAYLGDIPSPIKKIPELKVHIDKVEDNLLNTIFEAFNLQEPSLKDWMLVKKFDKRAQFIEAYNYMPSRGQHWAGREEFEIGFVELQKFPQPIAAIEVYQQYLDKFNFFSQLLVNKL